MVQMIMMVILTFYGKPRDGRHSKFEIGEVGMTSPEKQVLLILDLLVSLLLL